LKTRVRDKIRTAIRAEVGRALAEILPPALEFHHSPLEVRQSYHNLTQDPVKSYQIYIVIRDRLAQMGVRVEDISIDVADFHKWLKAFPEIDAFYQGMSDVYIEKCLEHYLSFTYLGLSTQDTFIDIAASGSPYATSLRRRIGLKAYRLDLLYRKGIHGHDIGGDAGDTGLPKGFATSLALHCAYECFMGDADIHFVHEAARILKPGGRYVIVPLYLDNTYYNSTSPYCSQTGLEFDPTALKVWRDDRYLVPFSRHYSPEAFIERVYSRIPDDMSGTVYFIRNLPDLWQAFVGQRIYCYFLFQCAKSQR